MLFYSCLFVFSDSEADSANCGNKVPKATRKRTIASYAEELHNTRMMHIKEEHKVKMEILHRELATKELEYEQKLKEISVISRLVDQNDN